MPDSNCFVLFYENDNYGGDDVRYDGPVRVNNLAGTDYPGKSKSQNRSYNSLKTGPTGYLIAFDEPNLTGQSVTFGPNTDIPDLGAYSRAGGINLNWQNDIESFILINGSPSEE